MIVGPWSNWNYSLNNSEKLWGVKDDSQHSNLRIYEKLSPNDIVFFKTSQKHSNKFSKNGIFGVGKVTKKFIDRKRKFWPDEISKNKVIYPYRFEFKIIHHVDADPKLIPWINGLPYTKGLNHIARPRLLKTLLRQIQKKWNVELEYDEPSFPFSVNNFYYKEEIRKKLQLSKFGGIMPSKAGIIIVFSNAPEKQRKQNGFHNIYNDYFDEKLGLFHYTGHGRSGHQSIERGNKALIQADANGIPIHYFRQLKQKSKHEYLGIVEVVKQTTEQQKDEHGKDRQVLVFWLRPISTKNVSDKFVEEREEESTFKQIQKQKKSKTTLLNEAKKLSEKNKKHGPKFGKTSHKKELKEPKRDYEIVGRLKAIYDRCQVCNKSHFETNDGYYCEVHHLIPWHISYEDTLENLVVVCPTCHKKFDKATQRIQKELYQKSRINFPNNQYNILDYVA